MMLEDGGRPVESSKVMIGEGLEEISGSSKGLAVTGETLHRPATH